MERELGLKIHSVRGKGYKLATAIELLDELAIHQALDALSNRVSIEIHQSVPSTNQYLLERISQGLSSWSICLSETQTSGRGRRGRSWCSPFGTNLYFSLYVRVPSTPAELSGFSLVVGIAVARVLHSFGLKEVGLKWPNDVVSTAGKLAGVLLEMVAEQDGPSDLVIGIGINTKMTLSDAESIDQPWTDIQAHSASSPISRNLLAARLISELSNSIDEFLQHGFAAFRDEWLSYDVFYQKMIEIDFSGHKLNGRHSGITERGGLLFESKNKTRELLGGEISLRKTSCATN